MYDRCASLGKSSREAPPAAFATGTLPGANGDSTKAAVPAEVTMMRNNSLRSRRLCSFSADRYVFLLVDESTAKKAPAEARQDAETSIERRMVDVEQLVTDVVTAAFSRK